MPSIPSDQSSHGASFPITSFKVSSNVTSQGQRWAATAAKVGACVLALGCVMGIIAVGTHSGALGAVSSYVAAPGLFVGGAAAIVWGVLKGKNKLQQSAVDDDLQRGKPGRAAVEKFADDMSPGAKKVEGQLEVGGKIRNVTVTHHLISRGTYQKRAIVDTN